ncbi:hypothetical protein AQUCO_02600426v1 [Aquilegia coerulea]|uniref:Uncharacterized protein n=1 Tax=Aquilegia coerulea TaxID=218851 RepID=A0A2G5D8X8_AQUCA|nr:hypothetical protein AQUCO_02600426v1 [Aquilegia coerulea]
MTDMNQKAPTVQILPPQPQQLNNTDSTLMTTHRQSNMRYYLGFISAFYDSILDFCSILPLSYIINNVTMILESTLHTNIP